MRAYYWSDILPQTGVVAIFGKRGMGKTALAYYLAELGYNQSQRQAVVYGPPLAIQRVLPSYFAVRTELMHLQSERGKTVIVDEGSMALHARRSMSEDNLDFDRLMSLCRQRSQLLIVCTHHSTKLDIEVVREADVLAFKQPSVMHMKMERRSIRDLVASARYAFNQLPEGKRKRWAYCWWEEEDKKGFVYNPLPSFWSNEISVAVGMLGS